MLSITMPLFLTFSSDMATRLRVRRTILDIEQQELARLTGIQQGRLSEFETGRKTPSPETLERLAMALDCHPDQIRGEYTE